MDRSTFRLLVSFVLLIAACTNSAAPPTPVGSAGPLPTVDTSASPPSPSRSAGRIDHPTGARDLVLRVATDGGIAGPDFGAVSLPSLSLYGDGTIITLGAERELFPGPALPDLLVTRASPAGMQLILGAAQEAGLFSGDRHLDLQGVFDASTTTFTVNAGGGRHGVAAYALGIEGPAIDRLPTEERAARQRLLALEEDLSDLTGWLGEEVLADAAPYGSDEVRIFVRPFEAEPSDKIDELRWPLAIPLSRFGGPYPMGRDARCGTVTGDDLVLLRPLLETAREIDVWLSDRQRYDLVLRPLLPDEDGCPNEII